MNEHESVYKSRITSKRVTNIHNDVFLSVCYMNDKPLDLSLTSHKVDDKGETQYHHIILDKDDLLSLKTLLIENELL